MDTRDRYTGSRGCYLRLVDWGDIDLLFSWANDKELRKNSFSTNPITYEEHRTWFEKKYWQKDSQVYIFCEGRQEKGMLRLDFNENEVEISYSIAPGERRKGYGEKLILLAEEEICHQFRKIGMGCKANTGDACKTAFIKAQVKKENLASNRIFAKLGYVKHGEVYTKKVDAVGCFPLGGVK